MGRSPSPNAGGAWEVFSVEPWVGAWVPGELLTRRCRSAGRRPHVLNSSTASKETAHGVHATTRNVLAKRPDWQAWRRV